MNKEKIKKIALIITLIVFVLIIDTALEKSRYLTLPISPPAPAITYSGWPYTDRTIRRWSDKATFYIQRQESLVTSNDRHPEGYDYSTREGIFDYFDDKLGGIGWVRSLRSCNNYIAESNFFPDREDGWAAYKKVGSEDYVIEPTVCVVVVPTSEINDEIYYHVIFYTIKPSLYTQWVASLD